VLAFPQGIKNLIEVGPCKENFEGVGLGNREGGTVFSGRVGNCNQNRKQQKEQFSIK
jgi:hypothetical protein